MGERESKSTDTESPVTPAASPRGQPSASWEDLSRDNQTLVARSKSRVENCPRQSKLALQPSSGWKRNKSCRSRGPGPRGQAGAACQAPWPAPGLPLPLPLPLGRQAQENTPFVPGGSGLAGGSAAGSMSAREPKSSFPKGKRSGWLWVGAGQLPNPVQRARSQDWPAGIPELPTPRHLCFPTLALPRSLCPVTLCPFSWPLPPPLLHHISGGFVLLSGATCVSPRLHLAPLHLSACAPAQAVCPSLPTGTGCGWTAAQKCSAAWTSAPSRQSTAKMAEITSSR